MKIAPIKNHTLSLSLQYATAILLLMIMCMAFLTALLLYNQSQQNDSYIRDFGGIIAYQLASSSATDLVNKNRDGMLTHLDNIQIDDHVIAAMLFNEDNKQVASIGHTPNIQIDLSTPFYNLGSHWNFEPFISIRSVPITSNGELAGHAVVVFSQNLLSAEFKKQMYAMFAAFVLILILVLIISVWIGHKLTEPIRSLISATDDIRSGKIDIITDRRQDELGTLIDAINNMSQGLIRKTQVEAMLDKVLTRNVKDKIMDQLDTVHMAGEHVFATVLFADMVGFTSISEKISPEEVQKLLREYYSYFNACSRFFFGTVDKYIGDCVMVVFGAPKTDPKHQYHAIACAILMQKLAKELNSRRERQGLFAIDLRIGINSGRMMAGLIGSDDRMEYTVVGDAVNLASRLCNEAEAAQTIIEEALYDNVSAEHSLSVDSYKMIRVRGKEEPVKIYSVTDIEQKYRHGMEDLIDDILNTPID